MYDEAIDRIQQIIKQTHKPIVQEIVDFLQSTFDHYTWVGIYVVKDDMLHLGPWSGLHATEHTEIPIGHGICGSAAKTGKIENIKDVKNDDRYLSCFISTRSELVVPIFLNEEIIGEIDIDSDIAHAFKGEDELFLKKVADMLARHIRRN